MRSVLVSFLLFTTLVLPAQNLVLNPGFECHKKVPRTFSTSVNDFTSTVCDWTLPNRATSDYFCAESKANAGTQKNNFAGVQQPREGKAYCGIFYSYEEGGDYAEYLQATLAKPLQAGKTYTIRFYISLAEMSQYAVDRFGVCFSNKKQRVKNSHTIVHHADAETPDSVFFTDKENWMLVKLTYTANGGERFMIIGNFHAKHKEHLKSVPCNKKKYIKEHSPYYYIDNVCVSEVKEDGTDDCPCDSVKKIIPVAKNKIDTVKTEKPKIVKIETDKPVAFPGTLFDVDKTVLKPEAFQTLDSLADFLKAHPEYSIEIRGHTDNSGEKQYNLDLSRMRAKAVADYLISKGVQADRVHYAGYGDAQPVVPNDTPENKAKNRRVEYVLKK